MKKISLSLAIFFIITLSSCSNFLDKYHDSYFAKVAVPEFNYAEGGYYYDLNVEITCPTDSAVIYYKTNGTEPDTSSARYTSPIPVTGLGSEITIKAFAVKNGLKESDIAEATFTRTGEIANNAVGATNSATLRALDYTPDNNNTVFVSKTGNDISGTGTEAYPVATINNAITLCTAAKQTVMILDSET